MKYVQIGILAALVLVAALLGLNLLKDRSAPPPETALESAATASPSTAALEPEPAPAPEQATNTASSATPVPVKSETAKPAPAPVPHPTASPRSEAKSSASKRPSATPPPAPGAERATRPSPAPAPTPAVQVEPPAAMPEPHTVSTARATPAKPAATERYELMRPENSAASVAHAAAMPRTVTIPAGTILTIRTIQSLSSKSNSVGDTFNGTLDQPLVFDDMVIAERGSKVEGKVVEVTESGRVKGVAQIAIALTKINTSDGQTAAVNTQNFTMEAEKSTKSDAAKVGIATGIGAALGAIFGGGKGAAIGAAAGGGAGAGTVLVTRGKPAEIPSETRINFRLESPLVLTEKLNNH